MPKRRGFQRAKPMTSSISPDSIMLIMEERSKQYTQRFEALDKAMLLSSVRLEDNFKERFAQQDRATTVAFAAADKAVQAALGAAKEAVIKAEMAAEKRFESVNEFRSTLRDQQGTFPTRAEVDSWVKALDAKIISSVAHIALRVDDLATQLNTASGRFQGASLLWGYLIGAIGVAGGLIALFYRLAR